MRGDAAATPRAPRVAEYAEQEDSREHRIFSTTMRPDVDMRTKMLVVWVGWILPCPGRRHSVLHRYCILRNHFPTSLSMLGRESPLLTA